MSHYKNSVFIFRRDLRLQDNTGLNEALRVSKQVLPCFIFDPRQIEPHPYQSKPALQFMLQSLTDLQQQLKAVGAELGADNTEDALDIDPNCFHTQHCCPFIRWTNSTIAVTAYDFDSLIFFLSLI